MRTKSVLRAILLLLVVVALAYLYSRSDSVPTDPAASSSGGRVADSRRTAAGDRAIVDAFAENRSGVMVQSVGIVEKLLPDDLQGSRHQRFIIRLDADHTLLVSHNIDVASRIPPGSIPAAGSGTEERCTNRACRSVDRSLATENRGSLRSPAVPPAVASGKEKGRETPALRQSIPRSWRRPPIWF